MIDATALIDDLEEHARIAARACEDAAAGLLAEGDHPAENVARLNRFSETEARRAVRVALTPIRAEELMSIWTEEARGIPAEGLPGRTLIFAAGSIPEPAVRSVAAAAMVSREVVLRPSADDPWLAAEFARRVNALLDGKVMIRAETWPRESVERTRDLVGTSDSLVLFGTRRAVDFLSGFARPDCRVFVNGPRVSFIAADADGIHDFDSCAAEIADDLSAYDQLGCLSPSALYWIGGDAARFEWFRAALADALETQAERQGYSPAISPGAAAEIRALRAIHRMDGSGARSALTAAPPPRVRHPGWTLLTDLADPALLPSPGYQTLRLHRLPAWDRLPAAVGEQPVQCMGIAPADFPAPDDIARILESSGLSRVCPVGNMQAPPLGWRHDGNPFFPVRR